MKRFYNKSLLSILLVLFNIGAMIWLIVAISLSNIEKNKLPSYKEISVVKNDSNMLINKKYYTISKGDFELSKEYDATLFVDDVSSCYNNYTVSSLSDNCYVGKVVESNTILGSFEDIEIKASIKGRIVDIVEENDKIIISIFSSSSFIINALIPQNEFYEYDLKKEEKNTVFILGNNKHIGVNYLGVDYSYAITNGCVKVRYSVNDDNCDILLGATGSLSISYKKYENCFAVTKNAFSDLDNVSGQTKFFVVKRNNEYKYIEIETIAECGGFIIIDADGLIDGEKIYEAR